MNKKELDKLGRELSGRGYVYHPMLLDLWKDGEELPEYAKHLDTKASKLQRVANTNEPINNVYLIRTK